MEPIIFLDTEIDSKNNKVLDIGAIKSSGETFHSHSIPDLVKFISGVKYICGHNILRHDLKYISKAVEEAKLSTSNVIDTLFLSPLLFPTKPYHSLLKDDKLQTEDLNNPLNDSIKAKDLLYDEVAAFKQLDKEVQRIYYMLLNSQKEFSAFFDLIGISTDSVELETKIKSKFQGHICANVDLKSIITEYSCELAYSLALINCQNRYSITPPWVLKNYPAFEGVMLALRSKPCLTGCIYCNQGLDIHKGLKEYFGFDSYRNYGGEALQEKAVKAAIDNKSILAVFPTGGGKSITFQVPALMAGRSAKGLTVVISPLQSLMKDQVDNLEKAGITEGVTINGLLDPIERAKSFERVADGSASILYISPESLRSKTIEKLLLGRNIARFVIDEAHCFSSWGQDFRVDYLYIGDFIKALQEKKNLQENIPVSCFTATAKRKVIEDICIYFKEKLSLELEIFSSSASRTNLQYKVFEKNDEEEKYNSVRDLIEQKNCPTIIYVSRTKKAYSLAEKLTEDGFIAKPYHGKMDSQEKTANQNAFIAGEIPIMVATSAFGMGVDKKDVGMVIHYDISDSLENYIQEAGRAGRDENITADCFVLFNEEDLGKHFILLNQTKLSIKEIQQVWKAIKDITKFRSTVSNSALEIARKAGWDDNVAEIETRVTTAIAALEDAGYLKRGQNMPRIFANSILAKTAQEAIDKINASEKFEERQKEKAVRIIKKLFSSKSRKQANDETAESRIDYISDHLGIVKEEVINIINLLRDEKILADTKDLTAFIKKGENSNRSLQMVETYCQLENYLLPYIGNTEKTLHLKELNERALEEGLSATTPTKIKTILNFWAIKNWIKRHNEEYSKNHVIVICNHPHDVLKDKLQKRHQLVKFIVEFLYNKAKLLSQESDVQKLEELVEFSVHELRDAFQKNNQLFEIKISIEDVEDALFYLSRIEAIKIEGGFLVVYNRLTIDRLEQDNKRRYKNEDYQKLNQYYENKVQQIHIVGEYAKKMISDYKGALQFVEDYFRLNYSSFLNKYFPGSRQNEIKRNLTPAKFRQLFGSLSPTQLEIIKDNESKHVAVIAGPGSGKTRVLVHKLASLLLMEDVKHEQLLMVTFSRAAATEFKKRLLELIGNAANFVEIKTFHSYCFDLLGKVGSLEKSDAILKSTVEKIRSGEVEPNRITKTVLVIDEAQDMDADEFALIEALMDQNEEMRVIAVGDDDQNIYEFRGASSKYLEQFIENRKAIRHELLENYRSKRNLVDFSNAFAEHINHRLKDNSIVAHQQDNGQIRIIRYQKRNLITPLVADLLSSDLIGSTCILTQKNDEALQITGLLLKNGVPAKLIQSNDGFNIYNLQEIRYFLKQLELTDDVYVISDEIWQKAKRDLDDKFKRSSRLQLVQGLIRDFESVNTKRKYKSDLDVFIRESRLEDFISRGSETILVSTIHKAKGKEFDNVFILLEDFNANTDEARRQLYVALTRAKKNLVIHCRGDYFEEIEVENLIRTIDTKEYAVPEQLATQLGYKDIWLDYFITRQSMISDLVSGDTLTIKGDACFNSRGQSIIKFSKRFLQFIAENRDKGYEPKEARVNYVIYWLKEDSSEEIKIILPEVIFEKRKN